MDLWEEKGYGSGAEKPEFTGSSLEIGENRARAELYTKY